jgi:hypothetical protein
MPVVFVSHSSKDDAAVTALENWLRASGLTDTFVDHHGIVGDDKWTVQNTPMGEGADCTPPNSDFPLYGHLCGFTGATGKEE